MSTIFIISQIRQKAEGIFFLLPILHYGFIKTCVTLILFLIVPGKGSLHWYLLLSIRWNTKLIGVAPEKIVVS